MLYVVFIRAVGQSEFCLHGRTVRLEKFRQFLSMRLKMAEIRELQLALHNRHWNLDTLLDNLLS